MTDCSLGERREDALVRAKRWLYVDVLLGAEGD
jgi:hypothetical protein